MAFAAASSVTIAALKGWSQPAGQFRASGCSIIRGRRREMAQNIRSVMTFNPATLPTTSSVAEAARAMRDANIGDIIVLDNQQTCGILTDRDIVIRGVAEGRNLATTKVSDICSQELTTMSPTDNVEDAVRIMREKAIRRLPVIEGGKPVGIVSIGDLAVSHDPRSALGHISAAPANR
jgi:CBS domain-containing protein